MAHLFRTTSMNSTNKKQHQHHSSNGTAHEDSKIHNGKMTNGQQSRRNTMHPRVRDSVLSSGCSDPSSDEALLPFPSEIEDHTFLMDACNMESLMSFDVDEKMGEAWPVKCCFVVREIVQTEITYVQSLGEIIKGYLTPLYSHLLNLGESPNFIKTVFCNIVKIHQTHMELMEYFQETCMSPLEFVSSFLKVDFLNLYTVYCTSYAEGNECLERALADNSELREFIEQCQRSVGHSLPLSSQLIKPVQRILKYRLLLDELNKHFDAEHPHHKTIVSALDKMSAVAEQINTSFTEPKKMPKAAASVVAKKRTQQLKDLQKSRSSKGRKSSSPSPHLCTGGADGTGHESSECRPSVDEDSPRSSPSGSTLAGPTSDMPNVSVLRTYFENLEEEIRRQSYVTDCRMLKRASSMADTRMDPDSSESPPPTKLSPKTLKRRSSLTLTDFKFQLGIGARKGEKLPSPSEKIPRRRSSVEDHIRKHIAEVRANRQIPRTMV